LEERKIKKKQAVNYFSGNIHFKAFARCLRRFGQRSHYYHLNWSLIACAFVASLNSSYTKS